MVGTIQSLVIERNVWWLISPKLWFRMGGWVKLVVDDLGATLLIQFALYFTGADPFV